MLCLRMCELHEAGDRFHYPAGDAAPREAVIMDGLLGFRTGHHLFVKPSVIHPLTGADLCGTWPLCLSPGIDMTGRGELVWRTMPVLRALTSEAQMSSTGFHT